jgi:serine/threonine protein kinase
MFVGGDHPRGAPPQVAMSIGDSAESVAGVKKRGAGVLVAGRYRLASIIGSGGMGTVWLAHDLSLDANCAIKLIDDDKAANEEIRVRFEREAKASAQLRSAHVVDVFDFGEWDGTYFIAMEYLEGEDLSSRLERLERLDFETTYRIVAHVARALMSAHAQGTIHRDLKPENIFLVQGYDEEVAKVLDFGIAQHNAYILENKATREGAFLGTPCYVSPEQARGRPIDYRADLWSLGVIAFECLTGRLPFYSEALGELMALILYEPIPKPTSFNPNLPPGIDAWWKRAAARDREQRFQSAKEMADELGAVLGVGTIVRVPTVRPRHRSSYPSINDQSGVIIALAATATVAEHSTPQPNVLQQYFAQSAPAANREVQAEPEAAAPVQFRNGLELVRLDRLLELGLKLRPKSLWLPFILPTVVLLIVVGAILGVWFRGKSVDPEPVAYSSVIPRGEAPKDGLVVRAKTEPSEPLTVDMLPLVPHDVRSGKSAKDNGRTGANPTNPSGSSKQRPVPNRAPLPSDSNGRDYGI